MLGVHRKKVKIVPHDPVWKQDFEKEKNALEEKLGDKMFAIEHTGSTAIPNMSAKPVIDILLAIPSINEYESYKDVLAKCGYRFARDSREVRENVLFVKGEGDDRTHHLKLLEKESKHWKEQIFFRDYLIAHSEIAEDYKKLKETLGKQFTEDRETYTAAKNEFIQKVLEKMT